MMGNYYTTEFKNMVHGKLVKIVPSPLQRAMPPKISLDPDSTPKNKNLNIHPEQLRKDYVRTSKSILDPVMGASIHAHRKRNSLYRNSFRQYVYRKR